MPEVGGEIPPGRKVRYGVVVSGNTTSEKGKAWVRQMGRYHQNKKCGISWKITQRDKGMRR